jgi:hypothetical protein
MVHTVSAGLAGAASRWSLRQFSVYVLTFIFLLILFYYTLNMSSSDPVNLRSSSSSSSLPCLTTSIHHTTCLPNKINFQHRQEGDNLNSNSSSSPYYPSVCSLQKTLFSPSTSSSKGRKENDDQSQSSSCKCGNGLKAGDCIKINGEIRCLPSFVIVGAMKSGTGALLRWLGMHPNLQAGRGEEGQNEVHFFGKKSLTEGPSSDCLWRSYLAHFPVMKMKQVRSLTLSLSLSVSLISASRSMVTFDKSPDYMRSSLKMTQISSLLPNAKIIMILRNPTSRAYSGALSDHPLCHSLFHLSLVLSIPRRVPPQLSS